MSQHSQTSNSSLEPMLSQETFNEVFSNIGQMWNQQDLHRIQTECQMAPTAVQLTDNSIHENVEMTLDCINVMRPEQIEFPPLLPEQSFTRSNSMERTFKQQLTMLKQEQLPLVFKQEPTDNSFIPVPSTMATPPPEQPIPQPLIVSNTDFPGQYGFDLGFEEEKSPPTKSAQWTYSPYLEKLFVKMRCIVPIRLKLQVFPPPSAGMYVRVVVIYKQPEHYREIVERCPNHITKHKDGHHAPKHLLRCENPQTVYVTCPETGRHSLKIPLGVPQAGSDHVTEMFQFMCLSSCPGGVNRRPILVIFTLECVNQVLGRKVQNIRICACPGRDRGIEENSEKKKHSVGSIAASAEPVPTSTPNTTPPPTPQASSAPCTPPEQPSTSTGTEESSKTQVPKLTKKRSHSYVSTGFEVRQLNVDNPIKRLKGQDEEVFTIQVKGREKYELLLKVKESLDLMDMVPQAQVDNYRASCPPCGRLKVSQNSQNTDSQNSNDSQPDDVDGTPPFTQLSRSDSGSSYQSPTSSQQSSGGGNGSINAVRFTLRRTVSLEKKSHHHADLA